MRSIKEGSSFSDLLIVLVKVIMVMSVIFFIAHCDNNVTGPDDSDEEDISEDTTVVSNVIYGGVRSSSYGIYPFPSPSEWEEAMDTIASYFKGSDPCGIWIVGVMGGQKTCRLEFPSDGLNHKNISFHQFDKHESHLSHFDNQGIKVFLQVEPADADIQELIDIVLEKYGHHPCVAGFGIDVEWYRVSENPGWGIPVKDDSAQTWEQKVKSYNEDYKLFLKHWDRRWMPDNYRGDMIFVDDSQGFNTFTDFIDEMTNYWADYFSPNTVFFQVGYSRDQSWWQYLDNPPYDIGVALADRVDQNCGVFWVDFTLQDVIQLSSITKITGY
ncbi:MAG: hypothetical protein R6V04_00775 [bacterium]